MTPIVPLPSSTTTIDQRFGAFVAEQFPFAFHPVLKAFEDVLRERGGDPGRDAAAIDSFRRPLADALRGSLDRALALSAASGRFESIGNVETLPGVRPRRRIADAGEARIDGCDGFLVRESIAASLTPDERREILRGMVLTRAVDNRLKAFFAGGDVRWGAGSFQ